MGPLQESLSKALPSPTPQTTVSQSNRRQTQLNQVLDTTKTMQWTNNISSYKCFETIATPSPIPIAKNSINNHIVHQSSTACDVQRSSSLDSLANSDANQSEENSSSWIDTNSDGTNDDDDDNSDDEPLSDCDSINDCTINNNKSPVTQIENDLNQKNCENNLMCEKPIVTELVKKKSTNKLCENRNCAYREFEKYHTIDDCGASITDFNETSELINEQHLNETIDSNGVLATNVSFLLNNNTNQQGKLRRTSITSSGSVGRMETIIEEKCHEEPIEPKISVKEILARFETLTSLEVSIHKQKSYFFLLS